MRQNNARSRGVGCFDNIQEKYAIVQEKS